MCFEDDYNEYNDDPSNYDDLGELNRNEAMDYMHESDDYDINHHDGDDGDWDDDDAWDDEDDADLFDEDDIDADYDYDAGE